MLENARESAYKRTSWYSIRTWLVVVSCAAFVSIGCDQSNTEGTEGISTEEIFAPPTEAERKLIEEDWANRDTSPQNVQILAEDSLQASGVSGSTVTIVSHDVAGVTHVGAIITPELETGDSVPVLVYNHGGDQGENLDDTLPLFSLALPGFLEDFVVVVPSFRSESLQVNGITYQSEGPASPWDFDVDDAMGLLSVALEMVPEADPSRIVVLGFSRGGGVGLLMGIRDPRIDMVIEYFGPTDLFVESSQKITLEVFDGFVRDLPGLAFLNEEFLIPYTEENLTLEALRIEYIRRSAVYFADRLPLVQVHHGELDDVVNVDHALSLEAALVNTGRNVTDYEVFIYPAASHTPFEMPESFGEALAFIERLNNPAVAAALR